MAEDEERREGSRRPGRRDPARNLRRDPPVIEGTAEDLTPVPDSVSASGDMMAAPPVEAEHPDATRAEPVSDQAAGVPETAQPPEPDPVHGTDAPAPEYPGTAATSHDAGDPPVTAATSDASAARGTTSRWGTLAALGFVILAAGLLYLFYQLSSLPPDNSAAVADLRSRLAAVESRPATGDAGLADRVAKLDAASDRDTAAAAALGKRVDDLAAEVSRQAKAATEVSDLQAALSGVKSDLAEVKASVAALPRPDFGRLEGRVGDLDQRLATLQGAVSTIPHVDLGPVTGKIDAIEARLKPIEAETAQAQAPQQVAQRRAAPVAVTAGAISDAIQAGRPFPKALEALRTLGVEPGRIAPLASVAESGAPTLADLQTGLADQRERIVSQGAAPVSGSYMDRLMAGASNLVQVRPVGAVVGDSPSALVSQMDEAIGRDDLTAALADWDKLPEASRSVSKSIADRLKLRLEAERAATGIASDAVAAMATPRG